MPAPSVRNDWVWARHERQERKAKADQARQFALMQRQHLAKGRAEVRHEEHRKRGEEKRWQAAQTASEAAAKKERKAKRALRETVLADMQREAKQRAEEFKRQEELVRQRAERRTNAINEDREDASWLAQALRWMHAKSGEKEGWREWEAEQERTAEARQKAHREATAQAMRARAASAARSSATAEREFRMRGEWHIAVAQRREAARQQRRAAMRRERAEAGREDNILYLNTHGDRLHWDPPRFEHTLEDGDGRWPYPMNVPVEPLRGGPPGARTFQYV